jgi:hypothetical protein
LETSPLYAHLAALQFDAGRGEREAAAEGSVRSSV